MNKYLLILNVTTVFSRRRDAERIDGRWRSGLRRNTDMGLRAEYASALSCNNRMLKICQDAQDACVVHTPTQSCTSCKIV